MNRFCSYLWVFEQAHADKTRSAFDKSQTTDIEMITSQVNVFGLLIHHNRDRDDN
jgi:hypothetical protein